MFTDELHSIFFFFNPLQSSIDVSLQKQVLNK